MFVYLNAQKNGILLRAQRDDEELALSWGHNPIQVRSYSFLLSSALAGVAGGLFAYFQGYISPSSFSVNISLMILTIIVVGGLGNIWGAVIATIILVSIPEILNLISASSDWVAQVQLMLDGAAVIVMVSIRTGGLLPERPRFQVKRVVPFSGLRSGSDRDPEGTGENSGQFATLLEAVPPLGEDSMNRSRVVEVKGLIKEFGGVHAVDNVSFTLRPKTPYEPPVPPVQPVKTSEAISCKARLPIAKWSLRNREISGSKMKPKIAEPQIATIKSPIVPSPA